MMSTDNKGHGNCTKIEKKKKENHIQALSVSLDARLPDDCFLLNKIIILRLPI